MTTPNELLSLARSIKKILDGERTIRQETSVSGNKQWRVVDTPPDQILR